MFHWTHQTMPPAITHLPSDLRETALAEANKLLGEGRHPVRALSIGISRALNPPPLAGPVVHVYAVPGAWYVWPADGKDTVAQFDDFESALLRGCRVAEENRSACYAFGLDGALLERFEYFRSTSEQAGAGPGIDVLPLENGWAVRDRSVTASWEVFDTKRKALKRAREVARTKQTPIHVFYADGHFQRTEGGTPAEQ